MIERRCQIAHIRLDALWKAMCSDEISPEEHVLTLREGLNQYHETSAFSGCETMGQLVRLNLDVSLAKTNT